MPFERLHKLSSGREAWVRGGPACPRNALVAGAWFMLREVELATSRAALLEIVPGPAGEARATWHLPASKTDQRAEGVARTHYCSCTPGSRPSASCVVHVLWDQALWLKRKFPELYDQDGKPSSDLPVFPTAQGTVVNKASMTATIVEGARRLGMAVRTADGSHRVTGHSLRVSGAQGLTRRDLDLWTVQLLGRWGSSAVHGVRS